MSRKTREEVLEEFRCGTIQDAALAVIARKGVEDATIQEIADEAGVAKGTVYVYFRDRDELFQRTADHAFDRLIEAVAPAFDHPGPIGEQLRDLIERHLGFFDENLPLLRATMALAERSQSHSRQRFIESIEKVFAAARERGEIRDLDPHAVAALYRDCIRGVILRRADNKDRTTREYEARFLVSILLHGIEANGETSNEA